MVNMNYTNGFLLRKNVELAYYVYRYKIYLKIWWVGHSIVIRWIFDLSTKSFVYIGWGIAKHG